MPAPDPAEPEAETAAPNGPVLDLDTLIRRPRVAIDGVLHEILSPDELSVIDSHRFGVAGRRIEELADLVGEEAEAELADIIDTVSRKVAVGVPDEVFAKLSGAHRWAIVDVFTGLLLGNRLSLAGAMQRAMGPTMERLAQDASSSTGASGSPGSSASTAGTRRGGFAKRLLRWCGLT